MQTKTKMPQQKMMMKKKKKKGNKQRDNTINISPHEKEHKINVNDQNV